MIDLSLILPVHNEEDIIEPVFHEIYKTLEKMSISFETILVENGSSDNSLELIKKLARKYPNTKTLVAPKGYGSAIIAGLKIAKGEYVCYMPSDGQVDMKDFPRLWDLIKSGKWDIVKIKRRKRESLSRLLVSYSFSLVGKILFGIPFIDINGDPRIFLRKYLNDLDLQYQDSFIDTEFAVKAHKMGLTIKEIPAKTLIRAGGKSTRSWRTFTEFFKNLWYFRKRINQ
ncbi:MAG: glycosyltransferase family 2 protein [Candidatus Gottesmanbacteria bacterium]